MRNQDRHGQDMATRVQAQSRQVDYELLAFFADYEGTALQHMQWLFDTTLENHRNRSTAVTQQRLNTWKPIVENMMLADNNPEGDPHNPENCPYHTTLETR